MCPANFSSLRDVVLQLALLDTFSVFGNREAVNAVLNVAVHEGGEVVNGVIDAVVGDATLGKVVGANLGRTVAGGDHGLATRGDVVHVFAVLAVVDEGAEA